MRIEELNIGDWVCAEQLCGVHNEPRLTPPMKVVSLGESWVNLEIDPEQGDPFEFEPSEIRGIPITPEILEKNGFVRKDKYQFVNIDMLSTVEKYGYKYYDYHNIYKKGKTYRPTWVEADNIRYVHELQHTIRLAGINKEIEV